MGIRAACVGPATEDLRVPDYENSQAWMHFAMPAAGEEKILKTLAEDEPLSVSDLSFRTGISRSWIYRLCFKGARREREHSIRNPDPATLLGKGKISVKNARPPYRFGTD